MWVIFMHGNYYVNRFIDFILKKPIFVPIIWIYLYMLNLNLAWKSLQTSSYAKFVSSLGSRGGTLFKILDDAQFVHNLKIYYMIVSIFAVLLISNTIFEFFVKPNIEMRKRRKISENDVFISKYPYDQDKLQLIVGLKHKWNSLDVIESPEWLIVPEKGLFQDFMIIGGKGTGKTAGCMYPFTMQMIYYKAYDPDEKTGMLILDVKGNYHKQVMEYAKRIGRRSDVKVIRIGGEYKYNPLHKPSLKSQVLANRLRTILELFSTQTVDSYWLDKAEVLINEAIKLVRLYNKGYVTFVEIHKIINNEEYLNSKLDYLQKLSDKNLMNQMQKDEFKTCKDYFINEYRTLDTKIITVIKSEVTRMTYTFVSDPQIVDTFCTPKEKLNFFGFDDLVDNGRIVVLDMNIAEFRNLSKIIAAYLKLDFQTAAMQRITRPGANKTRPLVYLSDENQEYVTLSDADFYAVSREARCVNIIATQSYSSLLKTLKTKDILQTILTNLTNKIWLRTDDELTISLIQKQVGLHKVEDVSRSIGENSKDSNYNFALGRMVANHSNINQGMNWTTKWTDKFKDHFYSHELPIFKAVCFLSDGDKIMHPTVVHLQPYFTDVYDDMEATPAEEYFDIDNGLAQSMENGEGFYTDTEQGDGAGNLRDMEGRDYSEMKDIFTDLAPNTFFSSAEMQREEERAREEEITKIDMIQDGLQKGLHEGGRDSDIGEEGQAKEHEMLDSKIKSMDGIFDNL